MFVDSHCHLEMENFDQDRDAVIRRALDEGLVCMVTVGTEEAYFPKVLSIIERYPQVYGAIAIHPHNGADYTDRLEQALTPLLVHEKIVGYGEIGLDFFKNYSPREAQIEAFTRQMALAKIAGLPIIIHSRDAKDETIRLLAEHAGPAGGVIHCYSYDVATARKMLDLGFYISIPGTVTYRSAAVQADVVRYVPTERLLAETDAPFLTPEPYRGKRNEPAFVKRVFEKIAQIKKLPLPAVTEALLANFRQLFLKEKL